MRITNKTDWDTAALRRVFSRVLAKWNAAEKGGKHNKPSKRLKYITIVYARRADMGCFSGHAYYNSGTMRLRLPRPIPPVGELDVFTLAFLFEHELAHTAGLKHEKMGRLNHWKTATAEYYGYVSDLTVALAVPKPKKPKPDVQVVRYERAVVSLKKARAKAKRYNNLVKKHEGKVRYYERHLSADGRLAALKSEKQK